MGRACSSEKYHRLTQQTCPNYLDRIDYTSWHASCQRNAPTPLSLSLSRAHSLSLPRSLARSRSLSLHIYNWLYSWFWRWLGAKARRL